MTRDTWLKPLAGNLAPHTNVKRFSLQFQSIQQDRSASLDPVFDGRQPIFRDIEPKSIVRFRVPLKSPGWQFSCLLLPEVGIDHMLFDPF